jgi:hypothetical protein
MTPPSSRASSTPSERPDTSTARQLARRCGGARSPTRGRRSCGVTVVRPVRREKAWKRGREVVRVRGSHWWWSWVVSGLVV